MSVSLIDTAAACKEVVAKLLNESEVACDLEGVDLSRRGKVSILQLAPRSDPSQVYLIDITTLQQDAFVSGDLSKLLESESVLKVMFDPRNDCDALHHVHQQKVNNIYDVQIAFCVKENTKNRGRQMRYVKGMKGCLELIANSSPALRSEMRAAESVKEQGLKLFAPELGGCYSVWEERPLQPVLVKYCAYDVKYLFAMKDMWGGVYDSKIVERSRARVDKAVARSVAVEGRQRAVIDFSLAM